MHGTPVITTAGAMVDRLSALGAKAIGLVSPYSEDVNEGLRAYLAASNIAVIKFVGLPAMPLPVTGTSGPTTSSFVPFSHTFPGGLASCY